MEWQYISKLKTYCYLMVVLGAKIGDFEKITNIFFNQLPELVHI